MEADKALERRFHPILVREPNVEETIRIMEGVAPRYEKQHHVHYEAGARRHISLISIPSNIKKLEQENQRLQYDKSEAFNGQDFEAAASLQMKILEVEEHLKSARKKWESERGEVDSSVTDAQGHVVSFRNTILIETSNLGTEALSPEKRNIGFIRSETPYYLEAKHLVMHEVKKFFKPEFLNRLDDIIVFHYLEEGQILQIAHLFVKALTESMK
ncbi:MAG: AAA family ATPase [Thiohalomonas sp.]|nr:AAA family ATPase [Thiohalomonas sp.]